MRPNLFLFLQTPARWRGRLRVVGEGSSNEVWRLGCGASIAGQDGSVQSLGGEVEEKRLYFLEAFRIADR